MEKQVGNFSYNDISKEEMAAYFERLLNNEKMKEFIASAPTVSRAHLYYRKSARMLLGYVLATGDLSEQMQQKLLTDFIVHKDECFAPVAAKSGYRRPRNGVELNNDGKYFNNHILPEILTYQAKKQNVPLPLSGENLEKVLSAIYIQGQNTQFLTHSFNGALLDEVRANGLDISKEKFKDEFDELRSVNLFQPYKKGVLCTCELTETTFGYAVHSPERVFNAFKSLSREQKNNETLGNFLSDSLRLNLQEMTDIDEAKKEKVWQAGQKIIDFYTTGGGKLSAIAFKKDECEQTTEISTYLLGAFGLSITKYKLGKFIDNDEELKAKYNRIRECIGDNRTSFYATLSFLSSFQEKYPNEPLLKDFVSYVCTETVCDKCLRSFKHGGYGDGHVEPNGKIAVKDMAIAVFDNPEEYYAKEQRIKEKTYELMFKGYEREQYKAFYADDFRRGVTPKESFEEFGKHHPEIQALKRNPDGKVVETEGFKLWQKKKGYDVSGSLQSINLRKNAVAAVERADNASTRQEFHLNTDKTR